ncbi:type II DNA modification methyltransferase [mine drainage metagenome]|uniref:Type II DNA modification methyltransferase n=1 Tax=mine drainage metagenome TaxID=410659 RepID=T1AAZ5_9ZZZZ
MFRAKNLKSCGEFKPREHSAKPKEIRCMLERASPGSYLELFARRTAPGWTVWGNQVETDLLEFPPCVEG